MMQVSGNVPIAVTPPATKATSAPQPSGRAATTERGAPSAADVQNAVNRANTQVAGSGEGIKFSFNDQIGQLIVHVVDASGSVIRQIPSKEFIAAEVASQAYTGMLLDKQG